MKSFWQEMKYNRSLKYWMIIEDEDHASLMQSGKGFFLELGSGEGMTCRLECQGQWYVVVGCSNVKLNLKTTETYRILV